MSSIQERLQMKREPIDKWSVREQLCLASAVAKSGDQNWMSASRALKPFGDPNRPADWFHQKNCAAQYGALLGNVETPKRKKRLSGTDSGLETPAESILRRLLAERQAELRKLLSEEKSEYLKLQEELAVLQAGKVSEEQLDKWCKEIDDEEHRKEKESIVHSQWLKERELRKQEIERAWRPAKPIQPITGQKRKNSDSLESLLESEQNDEQTQQTPHTPEIPKPALSPLLTSLLKSPSQTQNVVTSSILHSAITNQRPTNTNTSPMIASLLSSSTSVNVSPSLQHLVTNAIGPEPAVEEHSHPIGNDILDDPNMPHLKLDDLASSILVQDGPLPEIKKEEVDDIISEIIENAHDIVADPEQHLQLDGNGDINISLDLGDFDDDEPEIAEPEPKVVAKEVVKAPEATTSTTSIPSVDPFEFQEDPVIFEPTKPLASITKLQEVKLVTQYQPPSLQPLQEQPPVLEKVVEKVCKPLEVVEKSPVKKEKEIVEETPPVESIKSTSLPNPVDVVVLDETVEDKVEETKAPIEEIVKTITIEVEKMQEIKKPEETPVEIKLEAENAAVVANVKEVVPPEDSSSDADLKPLSETKKELCINLDVHENIENTTITPDFTEELYDEVSMEVKIDKSGKAKRDYSRTKKKEEKGFDMLLAMEKAQMDDDLTEENLSDKEFQDSEKKDVKSKLKSETDRSNSPWTEEEDNLSTTRSRRRFSTPATPSDSVPNSPASSVVYYDDDRDYRNWKKSVMLLYNRLATNKYASLFLKPITEDQAPGYNNIVYRPMDLQTIKKNIESGVIRTTLEFKKDLMLMFNNAIMYNKSNGTVYNMAKQMQEESLQPIEIWMQAQLQADVPGRRETRTSESSCKRKRTVTGSEDSGKNKKRKDD